MIYHNEGLISIYKKKDKSDLMTYNFLVPLLSDQQIEDFTDDQIDEIIDDAVLDKIFDWITDEEFMTSYIIVELFDHEIDMWYVHKSLTPTRRKKK